MSKTRTTLLCLLLLVTVPGCVSWDPIVLPAVDFVITVVAGWLR